MAEYEDALVGFMFRIELDGKADGFFTEVSGIGSETELIEHKIVENGLEVIKMIPGRLKWEPITLKRGITSNMDMWQWRKEVEDGLVSSARTNGSIIMLDQEMNDVARWDFEAAWPSKISGPQPKADSNEVGIEEMTIVHEGIKRTQ